jgi:hypothetical protein
MSMNFMPRDDPGETAMIPEKRYQWLVVILSCLLAFFGVQVSRLSSRIYDLEFQARNERLVTDMRLKVLEERVHVGIAR